MNGVETIKELLDREDIKNFTVSRYLGERTQDLNQQLVMNDMKVERFSQLAAALGYRVELVKVGYRFVSREYIEKLTDPVDTRNVNERANRNALFCTTEKGITAVDNRTGKMIRMDFQKEQDLLEYLLLATSDSPKDEKAE